MCHTKSCNAMFESFCIHEFLVLQFLQKLFEAVGILAMSCLDPLELVSSQDDCLKFSIFVRVLAKADFHKKL